MAPMSTPPGRRAALEREVDDVLRGAMVGIERRSDSRTAAAERAQDRARKSINALERFCDGLADDLHDAEATKVRLELRRLLTELDAAVDQTVSWAADMRPAELMEPVRAAATDIRMLLRESADWVSR